MKNIRYGSDYKVKMKFDKNTLAILELDAFTFDISLGMLIERCVVAYCKDSKSEKLKELEEKSIKSKKGLDIIEELLLTNDLTFKKTLINLFAKKDGGKSLSRRRFKKGTAATYFWSPTKEACKRMLDDERTDSETSVFFRDLLEEYASFPFGKRERIILAEQIKYVNKSLGITDGSNKDNQNKKKPFEYVSGGGYPYVMHPYAIKTDPYLQYNYVIGHAVPASEYDPKTFVPTSENIHNIRLLNLRYRPGIGNGWINMLDNDTVRVDEAAIINKMKNVPIGFLSGKQQEIIVEMNAAGVRLYRSIIHNRPRIKDIKELNKKLNDNEDEFKPYTFVGTIFQAVIYFMNFEDKARIISPPEAVEAIKERLNRTLRMYE